MHKIWAIFLLLFAGCESPQQKNNVSAPKSNIEQYQHYLDKECKGSIWEVKGAMDKYVQLFKNETDANKDSAFEMMMIFTADVCYNLIASAGTNTLKIIFCLTVSLRIVVFFCGKMTGNFDWDFQGYLL